MTRAELAAGCVTTVLSARLDRATSRLDAVRARLAASLERVEVAALLLPVARIDRARRLNDRGDVHAAAVEVGEIEDAVSALERFASTLPKVCP